jgi:hypothetical protein
MKKEKNSFHFNSFLNFEYFSNHLKAVKINQVKIPVSMTSPSITRQRQEKEKLGRA